MTAKLERVAAQISKGSPALGGLAQRLQRRMKHFSRLGFVPVTRRPLTLPSGALSITFDDFPRSAWQVGGDILARHSKRGTYYLSGGLMSSQYRDVPHFEAQDLVDIALAGHELGCHTFDHLSALNVSPTTFQASVRKNAAFLEDMLPGTHFSTFAYPFGDEDFASKRFVAGSFLAGRGIRSGANSGVVEIANLKALQLEERKRGSFNIESLLTQAAARREWIIAFTHDVSESPSPYGCRPDDIEGLLDLAARLGLTVAPVAEVLRDALIHPG